MAQVNSYTTTGKQTKDITVNLKERSKGFEVSEPSAGLHGFDIYGAGNTYVANWYNNDAANPLIAKGGKAMEYDFPKLTDISPTNIKSNVGDSQQTLLMNNAPKSIGALLTAVNETLRIQNGTDTVDSIFKTLCKKYDRYKLPKPNLAIRGFYAHTFFVRPKCNILDSSGNLIDQFKGDPTFSYANKNCHDLLVELSANHGPTDSNTQFMLSLSNYVKNFSTNDEEIDYETYGETYTGYKVAYGKHDIASKTARSITLRYQDDPELHIYHLHKLWVDYIAKVYRGHIMPDLSDIVKKVIDYAGAIYYILTAEDNETIVFWTKYYGVFPRSIPSSQFSWDYGNLVKPEELTVEYMASWKKDYDPSIILEFNTNANVNSIVNKGSVNSYNPYDNSLGHADLSLVGVPYILQDDVNGKTVFKLKYK